TEGDYNVKSAYFDYSGPASMKAAHPEYPKRQTPQRMTLKLPQVPNATTATWAGMPYTLLADGVVLQQGVVDESGALKVDHQVVTRQYTVCFANNVSLQIPVPEQYRNAEQGHLATRGLRRHTSIADRTAKARNQYVTLFDQEDQA
ncbi:Rhs element Vgr protein, partial [Pseudomonas sp. NPDC089396]